MSFKVIEMMSGILIYFSAPEESFSFPIKNEYKTSKSKVGGRTASYSTVLSVMKSSMFIGLDDIRKNHRLIKYFIAPFDLFLRKPNITRDRITFSGMFYM